MYKVPIEARESEIDGKGVFATGDIQKDTIVWQFTNGHDIRMTKDEFEALDEATQTELKRIAYLSPTTGMWVMPPTDDPACFTNHNPNGHNISVVFDDSISDEPFFVANRDIRAGEEITNNYLEFDKDSTVEKYPWLKP